MIIPIDKNKDVLKNDQRYGVGVMLISNKFKKKIIM